MIDQDQVRSRGGFKTSRWRITPTYKPWSSTTRKSSCSSRKIRPIISRMLNARLKPRDLRHRKLHCMAFPEFRDLRISWRRGCGPIAWRAKLKRLIPVIMPTGSHPLDPPEGNARPADNPPGITERVVRLGSVQPSCKPIRNAVKHRSVGLGF